MVRGGVRGSLGVRRSPFSILDAHVSISWVRVWDCMESVYPLAGLEFAHIWRTFQWRVALGRPSCELEQVSWGGWMSFGTLRCGPSSERRDTTQGFPFLLFPGKCRAIFELLGWDGRVQRSWEISPLLYCRLSTSGFASGDLVDWHASAFVLVDLTWDPKKEVPKCPALFYSLKRTVKLFHCPFWKEQLGEQP